MMNTKCIFYDARGFAIALIILCGISACSQPATSPVKPTLAPQTQITPMTGERVVLAEKAPLRAKPAMESLQLALLDRGQTVKLVGISSDGAWYQVQSAEYTEPGWILAQLVGVPAVIATQAPPTSLATLTTVPSPSPSATSTPSPSPSPVVAPPALRPSATLTRTPPPPVRPVATAAPTRRPTATPTRRPTAIPTRRPVPPKPPTPKGCGAAYCPGATRPPTPDELMATLATLGVGLLLGAGLIMRRPTDHENHD